jgi:hypothetical protein
MTCKKKGKGKGGASKPAAPVVTVEPVAASMCDQMAAQIDEASVTMNMRIAAALVGFQNVVAAARADYDKSFSAIFGG